MRNKSFTRFLCLVLAVMCLGGGGMVAVNADETASTSNLTDKSIVDYKETLNTISYEEYQLSNFGSAATLPEEVEIALADNWTFDNDNVTITMKNGVWTMYVLGKAYANANEVVKDGLNPDDLFCTAGGAYRIIEDRIDSVDAAVEKGYKKDELAYVEDDYEGRRAIYTPSRGTVTWDISLADVNITEATLVSIALDYFPVFAKSSAIEREFYINGVAPYSETRSLRFAKLWSSYAQGSTNTGTRKVLTATYTLGKDDDLKSIVKAAEKAGFVANETYKIANNKKSITFQQPTVITSAMSKFIDKYELRFFATDINNNEMRPTQLQNPDWTQYILSDSDGFSHSYKVDGKTYNSNHFGFVLTPDANGMMKLTLDGVNEPMALSSVTLMPYESPISYKEYYKAATSTVGKGAGKGTIKIEAENTVRTSTNVVYPIEDRTSALCSPVDTTRTVLNTIGTEKWSTPGQWVEYSFSVDKSGWYDIYSRYKQSYLDGMYVSRSLEVFTNFDSAEAYMAALGISNSVGYYDGLPFAEAANLRYDYDTGWQVTALSDEGGEDKDTFHMYFEKGVVYTLRFQVTLGSMSDQVRKIESILNALNTCYLDIIKLTGTTPDDYRDYNFYRVLPNTLRSMVAQKKALEEISASLRKNAGVASTYTGICDKLIDLLERMVQEGGAPIAKNLDTFKSYVGSLGTFLSDAKTQPLQLDYISIQPINTEAPKAEGNFFQTFWHELLSFIQSFFRDYNSMGATEELTDSSRVVKVWVPYGRDQANVIRNLSTNGYTQEYGVSVDLKLVTGGTLLPSILAGMGPDVYLGLDQGTVINYAIRGALIEIEDMDGFDEILESGVFNDAAMVVLGIADADNDMHYYGLPETQGFSMMFVRLDVLADLGIEIPKTWDDLYKAQTTLQSNNMEIGVGAEYKYFLYQLGGDLWADGGMRINLDSPVGLKAFEDMCNMFTQNSFPYTYDAANRFRTGEMPIIIAGYTGLYNQLKVFATELDGCWTFVPVPGIQNEDGTINNDSISSVSAVVMISGTTNKKDAWTYMRWYTGSDCQESYANEMVAIIGDSAKHSTANRDALISMPWTYDEYVEVSKQFDNLASVNNYPGYYYIDRYTNFAFLAAYNDGADPKTEILSYINTINTEITRKRQEFKLETLELGQTLAEKRLGQATEALDALVDKYNETPYKDAISAARYAIKNASDDPEDYILLQNAADEFMDILESKWDGKYVKITKVNGEKVSKPSYYVNITKQTMEKADGGYAIKDLSELKMVYFIIEALNGAANAYASY
ncbi:MAG: extracellular solute-binding protein [Clostridia bacterium]|nr:extracellular solute-binding protein [Clostridia bacterium]